MAIMANSRPFEGFVVSVAAAVVLIAWMKRNARGPSRRAIFLQVVLPIVAVLAMTGAAMSMYNLRVTGNPLRLPYMVHEDAYMLSPVFLWGSAKTHKSYNHVVMAEFHNKWLDFFKKQRDLRTTFATTKWKITSFIEFYSHYSLLLPLIMLPRALYDFWTRFALFVCVLVVLVLLTETWAFAHYIAPAASLWLVVVLQSLRQMRQLRAYGKPVGVCLVRALVLLALLVPVSKSVAAQFPRPCRYLGLCSITDLGSPGELARRPSGAGPLRIKA